MSAANTNTIDAKMLQKMFLAGAKNLEAKKEWINELNVFPVPDGDTGTNMTLTILSAAREVSAIEKPTMEELSKAIKSGSLRGARGNSGVILSQLFRGFTKIIAQYDKIDTAILANACQHATETAYRAVMKPKEGTILTVAKGAADKAMELAAAGVVDISEFMNEVIAYADEVLSRTPDMLPVLKQAGVVDSGGQGLMQVLKGAYDAFLGKELDLTFENSTGGTVKFSSSEESDIKFGYCTEFIIMLEKEYNLGTEIEFKAYLESIGDSIVVVSDDEIVKVHVHTNDPGLAIQRALTYGSLTSMKIDNMREEHHEKLIKDAEKQAAAQKKADLSAAEAPSLRKEVGYIAVAAGDGLAEIFKGLGADYVIEGGQTMNPSTEDMLDAINHVNADTVYILPNNSNIILAAQQATYLVEDKKILVVPTKTIPQGITAMINSSPENPEENLQALTEAIGNVKTGQITYAVRNTMIDDVEIKENDIMGLGDKTILTVGQDISDTAYDTIVKMMDEDAELISIYYGADVSEEDANALLDRVSESYPDCDIELQYGGQPIYYYILSVE